MSMGYVPTKFETLSGSYPCHRGDDDRLRGTETLVSLFDLMVPPDDPGYQDAILELAEWVAGLLPVDKKMSREIMAVGSAVAGIASELEFPVGFDADEPFFRRERMFVTWLPFDTGEPLHEYECLRDYEDGVRLVDLKLKENLPKSDQAAVKVATYAVISHVLKKGAPRGDRGPWPPPLLRSYRDLLADRGKQPVVVARAQRIFYEAKKVREEYEQEAR